jgi:small subunit ribosomal protein S16
VVKIKLVRIGAPHRPSYRFVVMDSRKSVKSNYLELLGTYNPLESDDKKKFILNEDKTLKWLEKGAQPTEKVKSILRKTYIWQKFIATKNQKEDKLNETAN